MKTKLREYITMANNKKHNLGFTLAEVLITLGIIGVVAAMTIPTLISNYQEKAYKTQYKKIFSELNQAMKGLQYDEKMPQQICSSMDDTCFRDLFAEKLKVSHKCHSAAPNLCQQRSKWLNGSTDNINSTGTNGSWPSFVTLSGYSVKFRFHYADCATMDEAANKGHDFGELTTCGWVMVDTNGTSKPNTVGKDIFFLEFMQDGFIPVYYGDNKVEDCKKGTGLSCSSLYINNGGMEF